LRDPGVFVTVRSVRLRTRLPAPSIWSFLNSFEEESMKTPPARAEFSGIVASMEEKKFNGMSYRVNAILPERRTLLFIHGLSGSLSAWYSYEEAFSKDFNMITVDLLGHGLSDRPRELENYAPNASAERIAALIDALGVRDVVLVSHSYGTIVALELVRLHAARFAGAIFMAAVYHIKTQRLAWLMRIIVPCLAFVLTPFPAVGHDRRTDYSRFVPAPDWSLRRFVNDVKNMGIRSYFFSFRHVYMRDWDSEWLKLKLPTLFLHGSHDSFVSVNSVRELSNHLTGSRLLVIKGGNHILPLNNVPEMTSAIREFAVALT